MHKHFFNEIGDACFLSTAIGTALANFGILCSEYDEIRRK